MSESSATSETGSLIQQGNAALEAGNAYEARKLFRRATELETGNVEAWVGLADSARSYQDKRDYLQQALALEPDNTATRARMEEVEARLAAGEVLAAARKPAPFPPKKQQADGTPPPSETEEAPETEKLFCYRHPDRPTQLQCTQCGNPICPECIRPALVGQLCPDCARERRQPNYQVSFGNLALTGLITLVVSYALSYLVLWFFHGFIFIILALLLAPLAGQFIMRILDYATRAKRGRSMQVMVAGSYLLGLFPLILPLLLSPNPVAALPLIVFTVVILVTLMSQLK